MNRATFASTLLLFFLWLFVQNKNWSNTPTQLELIDPAPFWNSSWAWLCYLVIAMTAIQTLRNTYHRWREIRQVLAEEKLTRQQEEQLRKLQAAFFTNISHDLRTHLTLINGNLNRLNKELNLEPALQKRAHIVEHNIKRLLYLSNELMDVAKTDTGKVTIHPSFDNIATLINEAYTAFQEHAQDRNINYSFLTDANEIFIQYDRNQLEKAIFNLISNAFKFTPQGGTICIILDNAAAHQLKIVVFNTGPTLPQEQLSQIFIRFYQGTPPLNDAAIGGGIGIGLSITKDIIELHHGRIEVQSNNGQTSFEVYLPKEKNHSNQLATPDYPHTFPQDYPLHKLEPMPSVLRRDAPRAKNGATILVVEDNQDMLDYIASLLEEADYKVLSAENGVQALALMHHELPDLIISDVMMPQMDGIELGTKLKTNAKTKHIPLILLTACNAHDFKMKGLEIGADDYLTKPFFEDELKLRVLNLLKIRRDLNQKNELESLSKPVESILNDKDKQLIHDLCQFIELHLDDSELKTPQIAKALNMSHSLLYKKLRAMTGQSLIEFIQDYRLQKAEMFLLQEQLSINEICYKVGFNDRNYFSICFKKKYKLSPREYLNAHKT
jgi:signal transduction histidine kinase/DNA-binding response OmpR family regulator